MNKKRLIILGATAGCFVIFGLIVFAAAGRDSSTTATKNAKTHASTNATDGSMPPMSTAANVTTTTSIKVVANEVAQPASHTFREPIRCASDGAPRTGGIPGDSPIGSKKWVTVGSISGSCDLSSKPFHLRGIDTRIVWQSDSSFFTAFLLDGNGLDSTAGYADAECSGPCADIQSLTNKAGDYTLRIQADGGPWQALVQEFK